MLFCRSLLPESLFLPHRNENGQLLKFGHAYQLRVRINNGGHVHVYTEQCEKGSVFFH